MNGVITVIKLKTRPDGKGGFGFIRGEDGKDRFFHARDLKTDMPFELLQVMAFNLIEGKPPKVTFDPIALPPTERSNGLRAANVEWLR